MVSASVVIVVAGLREIKPIALPLIVAIFLSVLSSPLLSWLVVHRIPKPIAVFVTVFSNLAVLLVMLLLIGGSVRAFSDSLPIYQQRLEAKATETLTWLQGLGVNTSELDWLQERTPIDSAEDPLSAPGEGETGIPEEPEDISLIDISAVFDLVGSTLRSIASLMTRLLLIFLMMVFILFEGSGFPRRLELALGWTSNDLARMAKARREVQHYLIIKTLVSLATGFLVYLWVLWMDVDFPLLWGLIAFLLNYIPSLGSIIAAIPAMMLTLIEMGPGRALIVGLGYLLVNLVLGNFVEPHLMGRQFGISTLVVFLSLVFWGWIWGPVGMLLSVPLTMILKIMLEHTEDLRWVAQLISNPKNRLQPESP